MQGILDEVFGKDANHSSGRPSKDQDDPSSNDDTKEDLNGDENHQEPTPKPSLVLGGTLLSPGPGGENVNLVVYPKDRYQNPLLPFDPVLLTLSVGAGTQAQLQDVKWSNFGLGAKTDLKRPLQATKMAVKYKDPPIEADFQNMIQAEPSVFSLAKSDVAYPQRIGCLSQGLVKLTPKDQYDRPRLGAGAAPNLTFTFKNKNSSPAPSYNASKGFSIRNDCLLLPFSLTAIGAYELTIEDPSDKPSHPRTFLITAVNALSPHYCTAQGLGLCSGKPNEEVAIYVNLKDQNGDPYTPALNENPNVTIDLLLPDMSATSIHFSISKDVLTSSYLRPATGSYQILIRINGVLLGDAPFDLLVTTATVSASVGKSTFSVWSLTQGQVLPNGLMALGDRLQGQITVNDEQGRRFYQPLSNDHFIVTWPSLPSYFTPGAVVYGDDGTYNFNGLCRGIDPKSDMSVTVSSQSNPNLLCMGSPLGLKIVALRQLSSIIAYGSGLEDGHDQLGVITLRGFDQYGVDWPVKLDTNCKLSFIQSGKVLPVRKISDNSASYQMPAPGSGLVIGLLEPVIPDGITKSSLKSRLFCMSSGGASHPTDASKCFVVWNNLVQNDLSTATLYAVGANGKRRRQGGDIIQMVS